MGSNRLKLPEEAEREISAIAKEMFSTQDRYKLRTIRIEVFRNSVFFHIDTEKGYYQKTEIKK